MNRPPGIRLLAGQWLTLLFLLLAGAMLWSAWDLSRVSGWIPRIVLSITCMLLLWQFLLDLWRTRPGTGVAAPADADTRSRRERQAAAWITALVSLAWLLGVVAGSVLFCLAWSRWHARERWAVAATLAAAVGLVLWLVFERLLGAPLHAGLLAGWLRGLLA